MVHNVYHRLPHVQRTWATRIVGVIDQNRDRYGAGRRNRVVNSDRSLTLAVLIGSPQCWTENPFSVHEGRGRTEIGISYVSSVGIWTPLPGREGLGEGRPCGAAVLAANLRPPCGPPLQGGRLRSLNTYAGGTVEVAKHIRVL